MTWNNIVKNIQANLVGDRLLISPGSFLVTENGDKILLGTGSSGSTWTTVTKDN